MEWRVVRTITKNQKSNGRMNLLYQFVIVVLLVFVIETNDSTASFVSIENRRCYAAPPLTETARKIDKEFLRNALDEDVDLASATKSTARIETHQCRLAGLDDIACAQGHFFLEAS